MIRKLTFRYWLKLMLGGYFKFHFYDDYKWAPGLERKPFIGFFGAYYDGYLWIAWIGKFAIEGTPR